jgi:hypothetical protein
MSELEDPRELDSPNMEELLTFVILQQMRMYDVLLAILMDTDQEAAKKLFELHKNHDTWGPPPFIVKVEE